MLQTLHWLKCYKLFNDWNVTNDQGEIESFCLYMHWLISYAVKDGVHNIRAEEVEILDVDSPPPPPEAPCRIPYATPPIREDEDDNDFYMDRRKILFWWWRQEI